MSMGRFCPGLEQNNALSRGWTLGKAGKARPLSGRRSRQGATGPILRQTSSWLLILAAAWGSGCATSSQVSTASEVQVLADGSLQVDGRAVDLDFLTGAIRPGPVLLRPVRQVPLSRVDAVRDHLYQNGFRSVKVLEAS